jgi:hypothetical protein
MVLLIHRYKGMDYEDTFSPVVSCYYSACVSYCSFKGVEFETARCTERVFLHGVLEEEVYMKQPPDMKISKLHNIYVS